jgi:two-component system sensor histidine kinase YesM
MAKRYGAQDISKTITSLSTFFRVFLSEGEEEISLEEEFNTHRSYLDIQQTRYNEVLSYEMSLGEDIKNARIIKIIIQPLVENAIYHGIKNKRRKGRIEVCARGADDRIEIEVRDDGIGMDGPALEALRASLDSGNAAGIMDSGTSGSA